jgi:hypothetical protein
MEKKFQIMVPDKEKEAQLAEYFLKSFEEKSPLDYDILDSMFSELKQETVQNTKPNP